MTAKEKEKYDILKAELKEVKAEYKDYVKRVKQKLKPEMKKVEKAINSVYEMLEYVNKSADDMKVLIQFRTQFEQMKQVVKLKSEIIKKWGLERFLPPKKQLLAELTVLIKQYNFESPNFVEYTYNGVAIDEVAREILSNLDEPLQKIDSYIFDANK